MPKTLNESAGDLLSAIGRMARKSQAAASLAVGIVKRGSQAGVQIQCGGTLLTAEDLWCNEALLDGYDPRLTGVLHGTCPTGETTTPVSSGQLTRGAFALNAGDRVVLLTEDEQTYYIVCKVVRLT